MRQPERMLVVDDEESLSSMLSRVLSKAGYQVVLARNGMEGLQLLQEQSFDLVFLDMVMPGLDGAQVLREVKRHWPDLPVIVMTGYASMEGAVEALRLGAYDYVAKPFNLAEIGLIAERALERTRLIDENRYLQGELRERYRVHNVIGSTSAGQAPFVMATKVAHSNATVLITGESGTGKEILARSIHYQSQRAEKPFVKVNCGALPEALVESELFGHEKGSFTDAFVQRLGKFETAHGGTVFLDEVGDIPPVVQVKLLRVLQEKEFERVGSNVPIHVDVRVIAATHRDLAARIAEGSFREDLYYRLNVVPIHLPALRDRRSDIPVLARHFAEKYCAETSCELRHLAPEAIERLMAYSWPGNIRELENCIERAVILATDSSIGPEHLLLGGQSSPSALLSVSSSAPSPSVSSLREAERRHIQYVLASVQWNISQAARLLEIDRKTLRLKIKQYGLAPSGSAPEQGRSG